MLHHADLTTPDCQPRATLVGSTTLLRGSSRRRRYGGRSRAQLAARRLTGTAIAVLAVAGGPDRIAAAFT